MQEVKAIVRPERMNDVLQELHRIPSLPGITLSIVRLVGRRVEDDRVAQSLGEHEMEKLELVESDGLLPQVVTAIKRGVRTGRTGDGKLFVLPVSAAIDIRTDERDDVAL